jgi:TPR repeat protein
MESLGRLCMKEDPDRAEAYFKKAFTPYCNNASYYMGLLCEQRGDMAGALQHYADCLGPWNTEPPADRHLRATADLCAKAALALAKAHHHGNAVKADIMRAVYYYSIAAYFGSKEAVEELAAHQRTLKEPEATYLSTAVLAWRKSLLLREDNLRLQKNLNGD